MKQEHDDLEERLRNLPKHSLDKEEKRKVIYSIRNAPKSNRLRFLNPLSVFVAAACLLMVAYLASPMYNPDLTKETEVGMGSLTEQEFIKSLDLQIDDIKSTEISMNASGEKLHAVRTELSLTSKELIPIDVWHSMEFRAENKYLFLKDSYGIGNRASYNSNPNKGRYDYTITFESLYANYSEAEQQKLLEASKDINFSVAYKGKTYDLNNESPKFATLDAPFATSFPLQDSPQNVIGIEGKIGILGPDNFVAEDTRRGAKLMLYYWSDPESLVGKEYKVEAINSYGEKLLLSEGVLAAGLYSEDAHILTSFPAFTTEGEWQISFYVEEELFEAFRIEVLPPFPKSEHYVLLDSPKEIQIGETTNVLIESSIGEKESIEVLLVNSNGDEIVQRSSFQNDQNPVIDAVNGQRLFHYEGEIKFPKEGSWYLEIDGEKTQVFEN